MGFWTSIKRFFSTLFDAFREFLSEVGDILLKYGSAYLFEIAKKAVEEMDKTDISNSKKRKGAFNTIKTYAKNEGIETRDSVINALIELAVNELKE